MYGPYGGRETNWENIKNSKWAKYDNVIIRGDLNLTMKVGEVWERV